MRKSNRKKDHPVRVPLSAEESRLLVLCARLRGHRSRGAYLRELVIRDMREATAKHQVPVAAGALE